EREIPFRVGGTDRDGVHPEQLLEIEVPHVLEVPSDATVAWHACRPQRVARSYSAVAEQRLHGPSVGHVGEGKTFGGERHLGPPCVLERAPVCPDPVVVGPALP